MVNHDLRQEIAQRGGLAPPPPADRSPENNYDVALDSLIGVPGVEAAGARVHHERPHRMAGYVVETTVQLFRLEFGNVTDIATGTGVAVTGTVRVVGDMYDQELVNVDTSYIHRLSSTRYNVQQTGRQRLELVEGAWLERLLILPVNKQRPHLGHDRADRAQHGHRRDALRDRRRRPAGLQQAAAGRRRRADRGPRRARLPAGRRQGHPPARHHRDRARSGALRRRASVFSLNNAGIEIVTEELVRAEAMMG